MTAKKSVSKQTGKRKNQRKADTTTEVVSSIASAIVSGESLTEPNSAESLSIADLAIAGIDMRITKADVLEMLMEEIKQQAEAQRVDLEWQEVTKRFELAEAGREYVQSRYGGLLSTLNKIDEVDYYINFGHTRHPQIGAVYISNSLRWESDKIRASLKRWQRSVLGGRYDHYRTIWEIWVDHKKEARTSRIELNYAIDQGYVSLRLEEALNEYWDVVAKLENVMRQFNDMDKVERRARYELVNRILSSTEGGRKLLANFNNFKTKKVSELKALKG